MVFLGLMGDPGDRGELELELDFDLRRGRVSLRPLWGKQRKDFGIISGSIGGNRTFVNEYEWRCSGVYILIQLG